ncbi:unnamed protein product [Spirodela intermedia]|uniref:Uncharacterized protein n=1 Tax=Spirodela intermedia TaxID=51605 RepID=A0A7I8LKY2_SPIIN|nr:unnamed protein product [Spirodela intermedia]
MAIVEMQQAADCPTFKLVIVGYGGTGKTTFAMRHLTGEFEKKYELMPLFHQFRVEVHPLDLFTNREKIRFKLLGHGWAGEIRRPQGWTMVRNKVAVKNNQVNAKKVTFHRNKNLQYYEISTKSNFNFDKPFLYLARKFGPKSSLLWGLLPSLPPEVQIDLDAQRLHEADLAAAAHPLPDEDDDAFD